MSKIRTVIGVVVFDIHDSHCSIDVKYEVLNDGKINPVGKDEFPLYGKIFGSNFRNDHRDINENDVIICDCYEIDEENKEQKDHHHMYYAKDKEINLKCEKLYPVYSENDILNLENKKICYINKVSSNASYILGLCKVENKWYESAKSNSTSVHGYKTENCQTVKVDNFHYLVEIPNNIDKEFDVSNLNQLANWFRKQAKISKNQAMTFRDYFNKIPTNYSSDIDNQKWERLKNSIHKMEFSNEQIKEISKNEEFQKIVNRYVESDIESYRKDKQSEYDSIIEEFKSVQSIEMTKISKQITLNESYLKKLDETINDKQNEREKIANDFQKILNEKERLKREFSFLNDILLNNIESNNKYISSYFIEELNNDIKDEIQNEGHYRAILECALNNLKYKTDSDDRLGNLIYTNSFAFSRAFLATLYCPRSLIIQPNPDWCKFEYLWYGGLEELWNSAIDNSEQWHVLIIQNINLAPPQCWGQPLWDVLQGNRRSLPFFGKCINIPDNLIVIATCVEEDSDEFETKLGLPVSDLFWNSWDKYFIVKYENEEVLNVKDGIDVNMSKKLGIFFK